jgi:hypothetical protein
MGKLIKLVLAVAILGGIGWFAYTQMEQAGSTESRKQAGGVRVEEKYGFTSQQAGG